MENQPLLTSQRLILRPFERSDAERVQFLAGDERIAEMTAEIPHPYPDGLAEDWIQTHPALWQHKTSVIYAVTHLKTADLMGSIGIKNMSDTSGELGYWIGADYWNQGYATEAGQLILEFAFHKLGLRELYAEHMVRNPASGKVLQKLGFLSIGRKESTCGYKRKKELIEQYRTTFPNP